MKDFGPARVGVEYAARRVELEYAWIDGPPAGPLLLFLHDALGSLGLWRDFPRRVCSAVGARGLVWSRYGYGFSTQRPADEWWGSHYLDREVRQGLPAFLQAVGAAGERPWMIGHSDGATLSLLYAAAFPDALAGLVAMAPHSFVEDITRAGIRQAGIAWANGELRPRLSKYHADPASPFHPWHDGWLSAEFADWNILDQLSAISVPVLGIQGEDDEYASMAQIDEIAARVPQTRLLKLPACGHVPYRDQPEAVIEAIAGFVR